jgi:hypothetical protein
MHLENALRYVAGEARVDLGDIRGHIDPEWIEQALEATGTATVRRRRLPAEQVVWLVIGMALMRKRSIAQVVDSLDLVLPAGPSAKKTRVAASAIPRARSRVGAEAMGWLFARSADDWAHASADRHRWRDLALYGADGTTLRVADTEENREHFGGPDAGPRGPGAYPMVRLVALMALRSHLIASAAFGAYGNGETSYATELWESVPNDSLTIVDKGFFGANILLPLQLAGQNRQWLTRAKDKTKWRVVKKLGPKDYLVEMNVSREARKADPTLPAIWQARTISYKRKGFGESAVLTSLTDPSKYPASEIVELYHVRWELELGYDEIKTEMLNREECLRSKSPGSVTQEIWGILIAYNLVRFEMEQAALEAAVEPIRISFVAALVLVTDEFVWLAGTSPGAIPSRLRDLREKVARYVLPHRRDRPSYPRAVKIKMSGYPRNRRLPSRTLPK